MAAEEGTQAFKAMGASEKLEGKGLTIHNHRAEVANSQSVQIKSADMVSTCNESPMVLH